MSGMLLCLITSTVLSAAVDPKQIQMNTGAEMYFLNLGGSAKPGHNSKYAEFLRQGGRGLDTALTYTDPVNLHIREAIKAHPEIPRADIFITTKVPCCPGVSYCNDPEYNGTILEDMAKNNALLDLDYTDITLLHHPCDTVAQTIERYLELEAAMAAGHTKAIGVSNFNADLLTELLADPRVKVVPAVNQCNHAIGNHNESHAPQTGGDDKTVAYCQNKGIVYSAYSPLEGLSGQDIFKNPTVIAIGKIHNVSGAQVALRWLVQQNITVVTASNNPAYIAEDLDLFSFQLSEQEMAKLAAI